MCRILTVLLAGLLSCSLFARSPQDMRYRADSLFWEKAYAEAARLYEQSIEQADDPYKLYTMYQCAAAYALSGDTGRAFATLFRGTENGFDNVDKLQNDTNFSTLKRDPRWGEVIRKAGLMQGAKKRSYAWGVYFGVLCIFFFYNLFLFFALRDRSFLFYSLLVFFDAQLEFFRTSEFGLYLKDVFFWLKYVDWLRNPLLVLVCLTSISYLRVAKDFMPPGDKSFNMRRLIRAAGIIFLLLIVLSEMHMPVKQISYVAVFASFILCFVLTAIAWVKGYRPARFFVFASSVLSLSMILLLLKELKLANLLFDISALHFDNVAFIVFYTLLSFAVADRINLLKLEKAQAQKKALEVLEQKVLERTLEVRQQKQVIEEKNKDITDSINYARRIQQARLPEKSLVSSALPDSFVLYKPKDIVSGDFYFFSTHGDTLVIAAGDCTGHGVPGALMSMIGSERLQEAVLQSQQPSEVLSRLNKGVKTSLRQSDNEEATRDGMDIALCTFEKAKQLVHYAGANRPLWIIRRGASEVEEIKATKKAIAGFTEDDQHFETHTLQPQEGDTLYLFTDGYADTFSGQNNKKLTTKKFRELLLGMQQYSMAEQEKQLDSFIEDWKAGTEPVDDILVIGIRF